MTQKLSKKNLLLVGFTLFSMFFGAGNLIFPPFLGAEAGEFTWFALGGFLISAVGLPVMGVAAVALSGGLSNLAGKVHPVFAFVFTMLIYLSIGPCLAIPRTSSTSFEMTILPFLTHAGIQAEHELADMGISVHTAARFGYSAFFFLAAMLVAFQPDKLTDRLGKVLCPALLTLIGILFTGSLIWPIGHWGPPSESYMSGPAVKGFLEGYQTMDTIAALNFGMIIAINIRAKGVTQEGAVVRETVKAGVIAGMLLGVIYGILAYLGAPVGALPDSADNGARVLTFVAGYLFGNAGMVILGFMFLIACFNTCVGLLSCCSQYFHSIVPAIGYQTWAAVFALISLIISCAGLNKILAVSVPVLNAIYPAAIVLLLLAFAGPLTRRRPKVFPWSISLTGITSFAYAAGQAGITLPAVSRAAAYLPGYSMGLGWIAPALAGVAIGCFWGKGAD